MRGGCPTGAPRTSKAHESPRQGKARLPDCSPGSMSLINSMRAWLPGECAGEVKSDQSAETPEATTTPEAWGEDVGKSQESAQDIEGPQEPQDKPKARPGEVKSDQSAEDFTAPTRGAGGGGKVPGKCRGH